MRPRASLHGYGLYECCTINADSATAQIDGTPLHGCKWLLRWSEIGRVFISQPPGWIIVHKTVSGIHDLWRKGR